MEDSLFRHIAKNLKQKTFRHLASRQLAARDWRGGWFFSQSKGRLDGVRYTLRKFHGGNAPCTLMNVRSPAQRFPSDRVLETKAPAAEPAHQGLS